MKMLIIASAVGLLATGTSATVEAQTPKPHRVRVAMLLPADKETDLALSAAPTEVARGAAVYVYEPAGYKKARESTNGFTCLVNRDSELDGYEVLKPTCWDAHGTATIVPAILEIARMRATGQPVAQVVSAIRAQIVAEKLQPFSRSGIAYMLAGDVLEYDVTSGEVLARAFPPHVMIYAPGIQTADVGVDGKTASGDPRVPLIYESATGYRYLVIRVPSR